MCGATGDQQQLTQEEMDAYKQGQQLTAQQYANQQSIYAPMAKQFSSIFAAGPNQTGYSAPELQALDSEALEGTAENYKGAAKAVNEEMAGQGGGTNPLPGGAQEELRQETADSAAAEESKEETGITESDYQQGYNEWQAAGSGLEGIAAGENPLGYEQAETGEAQVANTEANDVAEEQNSWINAAIGAAGAIGGGFAGGYGKGMAGGG
jgi:hypothetical protein